MFGEDLKKERKDKRMSQAFLAEEIANLLGIELSRQGVGKWETGETFPERDKWEAIETILQLPRGWVFSRLPSVTGTGNFTVPKANVSGQATVSPPPKPEPSIEPSTREIHRVPVISWVRAGNWSEIADPFYPGDADEWVDTTATMHPNAFALVVTGDSMEPLFHEGETIIVDPGREVINGSYVVAKNGDNEATFKQFVVDGSSVFLKPLNGRYPIKDMTGIRFSIVGVVVAKEMRF